MVKWNAEIICDESNMWSHFMYYDLSDSELIAVMELSQRGHSDVICKVTCVKESPEDVAVISGGDDDV